MKKVCFKLYFQNKKVFLKFKVGYTNYLHNCRQIKCKNRTIFYYYTYKNLEIKDFNKYLSVHF